MTRKAQIATAVAALALGATPTVLAAPGPQSDANDRAAAVSQAALQDASDRAGTIEPATQVAAVQDAHDRLVPTPTTFWSATGSRGIDTMQSGESVASYPEHLSDLSPAQPTVFSSGGFDWGDATIGVLGGIGLSLLLGGALILLVSHGRSRQRVAIR